MKKGITAIIPVKKNSSRLENKNVLPFAETTLLEHKIQQLKKCRDITNIIVSSDSDYMLALAENHGVAIDKRPIELADESKPFSDFLDYIMEKVETEHMMWACCTSPLMDEIVVNDITKKYYEVLKNNFDSLITTLEFKHFLLDEEDTFNFQRGRKHVNSQDLPKFDLFTNGAILAPVKSVKNWHYHFGKDTYRYPVSQAQSIDIDTETDYIIAKALWEYRNEKIK